MIDFMMIATRSTKRGVIEIYPKFIIKKSKDLMIRGGDFYAIWLESKGLWSTDEQDALQLIDFELDQYLENHRHEFESNVKVLHMWDAEGKELSEELYDKVMTKLCEVFCADGDNPRDALDELKEPEDQDPKLVIYHERISNSSDTYDSLLYRHNYLKEDLLILSCFFINLILILTIQ